MFGLFVELGPYYLNQDSLDDPKYNQTGIPRPEGLAAGVPGGHSSAGVGKWDGLMRDVLYPKL